MNFVETYDEGGPVHSWRMSYVAW